MKLNCENNKNVYIELNNTFINTVLNVGFRRGKNWDNTQVFLSDDDTEKLISMLQNKLLNKV